MNFLLKILSTNLQSISHNAIFDLNRSFDEKFRLYFSSLVQ